MSINVGYLTSDKKNNELYTPYYAVEHITKYISKDKKIWCPFDQEWSAFYQTFVRGVQCCQDIYSRGQRFL